MLIEAFKIDINLKDIYGKRGFIFACYNNRLKVVELLLEKYPDIINQKDNDGKTGYDYLREDCKRVIADYI